MRFPVTMILLLAAALPARAERVDLELVLAVDVSGSVDEEEAELQRAGTVAALTDERVIRAIKAGRQGRIAVAYVEWGGDHIQRLVVDWSVIDGEASAADFARRLAEAPMSVEMWTSISGVMRFALDVFRSSPHQGRRRVLDISGDGPNNDGALVTGARKVMLKDGITINGLPIINGRPSRYGTPPLEHLDWYYEDCVIGGPGAFIVIANTYRDFGRAIRRKMILEIAGRTPEKRARLIRVAERRVAEHPAAERRTPERFTMPCDVGEIVRESRDGF
ncbi:MAG: DUF1194 domain-containing protein [Proteobacteria bacterium]|nr:DUF1194 domain-containing protein [Pseudomonadota bacterium]